SKIMVDQNCPFPFPFYQPSLPLWDHAYACITTATFSGGLRSIRLKLPWKIDPLNSPATYM
ncbi:MAG: hypothetical protein AAGH79_02635, partial [Bacteroidota bacterium]